MALGRAPGWAPPRAALLTWQRVQPCRRRRRRRARPMATRAPLQAAQRGLPPRLRRCFQPPRRRHPRALRRTGAGRAASGAPLARRWGRATPGAPGAAGLGAKAKSVARANRARRGKRGPRCTAPSSLVPALPSAAEAQATERALAQATERGVSGQATLATLAAAAAGCGSPRCRAGVRSRRASDTAAALCAPRRPPRSGVPARILLCDQAPAPRGVLGRRARGCGPPGAAHATLRQPVRTGAPL